MKRMSLDSPNQVTQSVCPYYVVMCGKGYYGGEYPEGNPIFGGINGAWLFDEDQLDMAVSVAKQFDCEIKVVYVSDSITLEEFCGHEDTWRRTKERVQQYLNTLN